MNIILISGRDSVDCLATHYRLDGLEIESWCGEIFCAVQTRLESHPAFCTMGNGSFLGVKRPEHGADHPPPSGGRLWIGRTYTSTFPMGLHKHVMGWHISLICHCKCTMFAHSLLAKQYFTLVLNVNLKARYMGGSGYYEKGQTERMRVSWGGHCYQ